MRRNASTARGDAVTRLPTPWLPALLVVVVAVSPLLASWTVTLETRGAWRWWQPGCVTPTRWITVGAVAIGLTIPAAGAEAPWLAWTAFAAGGAVLVTVDARTHLLPARFLYPLALVIGVVLIVTASLTGRGPSLLRAALAAGAIGAAWLVIAFLAPAAIGLGDVRLFALNAALLGWMSWPAVLVGQFLTFLLAPVVAGAVLAVHRVRWTKAVNVPMGPSAVIATAVVGGLLHLT